MKPAIIVENISKQYRLGHTQSHTLAGLVSGAGRWAKRTLGELAQGKLPQLKTKSTSPTIWALKDVSLTIHPGEIVGIVGRNGNGKSTLLKVLSRITLPTSGKVKIRGQAASLLEVGTGFHPELTGRENVFLNGAIMGMGHRQIKDKLDEIVAFSEVGRFLDTPVKRYSSGMYVRLAFAVAAHLEPDILMVDEVLAVGDGAFQKKCLGKIQSVGGSNRTVLFVSHSLPTVRSICTRVILLDEGRVKMDGPTDEVLAAYNRMLQAPRTIANEGISWRLLHATGAVRVTSLTARDEAGAETWNFKQGQDVRIRLQYETFESVPSLGVFMILTSLQSGEVVTSVKSGLRNQALSIGDTGSVELTLPQVPLRAGEYALTIGLGDESGERRYDFLDNHQNLPWLCITSDDKELTQMGGYFSIPALFSHT